MSKREQIAMTAEETAAMLEESAKLQLATLNRDGSVHLVTMFYAMLDGLITFWTYRASQKARNLARDPRVTCLVETGEEYFDLRGVQVQGVVEPIEDPAAVLEIGRRIGAVMSGMDPGSLDDYVSHTARKRLGYAVQPRRVITWDHSKLLPPGG